MLVLTSHYQVGASRVVLIEHFKDKQYLWTLYYRYWFNSDHIS